MIYGAAIRTVRWLATEEGLAKVTELGVTEARQVLTDLQALAGAIQVDPHWRDPIVGP